MNTGVGGVVLKENTERLSMHGKRFSKVINIVLERVKQHDIDHLNVIVSHIKKSKNTNRVLIKLS